MLRCLITSLISFSCVLVLVLVSIQCDSVLLPVLLLSINMLIGVLLLANNLLDLMSFLVILQPIKNPKLFIAWD